MQELELSPVGGGLIGETIVVGVEVGQGHLKQPCMSLGFVHVVRAKISAC